MISGIATGEVQNVDPNRWEEIPAYPLAGYQSDSGIIPVIIIIVILKALRRFRRAFLADIFSKVC